MCSSPPCPPTVDPAAVDENSAGVVLNAVSATTTACPVETAGQAGRAPEATDRSTSVQSYAIPPPVPARRERVTTEPRVPEHSDVLVIGAGVTGAIATRELVEAGFTVVCLEQGDWTRRSEFTGAGRTGSWPLSGIGTRTPTSGAWSPTTPSTS